MSPRPYVRLPDDAEFTRIFAACGSFVGATAHALGCSRSSVENRVRALGLTAAGVPPKPRALLKPRVELLEAQINRLLELEQRVHALEARPITAIAVREDSRRIVDGGKGARHARRRSA